MRLKSKLNLVIVFSALLGLAFVIGCGASAEKQAMSDFLQQYSLTVDEYSSADQSKKAEIEEKFIPFGQGYQSMSPALRDFESLLLSDKLRHGGHPVMNMCAANAKVDKDPAGNKKLTKSKSSGRIDGMVALTMAIGSMPENPEEQYITGSFHAL